MSRPRDPVQQRDGRSQDTDVELHGVVDWEPRTHLDRVVQLLSTTGIRVLLVILALGLSIHEFDVVSVDILTDTTLIAFVVLSVLPALAIAGYIWYVAVIPTKPAPLLGVLFVLGGVFASFAAVSSELLGQYTIRAVHTYTTPEAALLMPFLFFVVFAPIEELVKLFVLQYYSFHRSEFSSVLSGALFGAFVGLGFATIENAVFISSDAGIVAAGRRALAGPGHVIYTAIAGFYLGLARFNREYAAPLIFKGLVLVIFFHGLYNSLVSPDAIDVLGILGTTLGFNQTASLFTFAIAYNGIIMLFLIHKLSRYQHAYRETQREEDKISSEMTEFDP